MENKDGIIIQSEKVNPEDVERLKMDLMGQLYKIQSNYLVPKFVVVGRESYKILSVLLYQLSIRFPNLPETTYGHGFQFVDEISFMGEQLEIVLIELEEELPNDFIKVYPKASEKFLRNK